MPYGFGGYAYAPFPGLLQPGLNDMPALENAGLQCSAFPFSRADHTKLWSRWYCLCVCLDCSLLQPGLHSMPPSHLQGMVPFVQDDCMYGSSHKGCNAMPLSHAHHLMLSAQVVPPVRMP